MADEKDTKRKEEEKPKDKPKPHGVTEGPGAPETLDEPVAPPPPPPPGGGVTEGPGK